MEKIIINDFCGIKKIDVDLAHITVLIGPQASGKSVCAKSLYFFKRFIVEMRFAIEEQKTKKDFDEGQIRKFEEYFPSQSGTANFSLRYEFDGVSGERFFIQIEKGEKGTGLKISHSVVLKDIFEDLKKEYKRISSTYITDDAGRDYKSTVEFEKAYRKILNKHLVKDDTFQLFIPAGRSFFGILQSSIFSFLATNTAVIDPLLKNFGSYYENVKNTERRRGYPENLTKSKKDVRFFGLVTKVNFLVNKILKGDYVSERGKDFLVSEDGRKTNLANASSGQQETLPLALILKSLLFRTRGSIRGATIYIEEPEAHIFPAAQKQIIQLISLVFNASKENIPYQFLITTHSPYILTSLNNLLLAGKLASKLRGAKKKELLNIIDSDMTLNITNIQCYSLKDGLSASIISSENELIESDIIDEVSDDLSSEFDKLLELEYR
jgi:predicted ATPase